MLGYLQMLDTEEQRCRFEEIYLTYRELLFYVANRILQNQQDAEDAVHQTFLKLAEHMELIPEGPCIRTRALAVTVAERTAIELYRRRRAHPMEDIDLLPLFYEREIEADGTLAAAIAALPPRYREVLLLKYYHGYRDRETAAFLGTTPGNVRRLISRAKKKLASELTERRIGYESNYR